MFVLFIKYFVKIVETSHIRMQGWSGIFQDTIFKAVLSDFWPLGGSGEKRKNNY